MTYSTTIFGDGKYTLFHKDGTELCILRNGEPWLSCEEVQHGKMLLAAAHEIDTLRAAAAKPPVTVTLRVDAAPALRMLSEVAATWLPFTTEEIDTKDLVKRLRRTASKGVSVWGDLQMEAALALEILSLEILSLEASLHSIELEKIKPEVIAQPASALQCTRSHPHENMDELCKLRTIIARLENEKAIAQPAALGLIEIDFKQATELLQMFADEPISITLTNGNGHGGKDLYAHYTEMPEEGAEYLGETDDEAIPISQAAFNRNFCERCGKRLGGVESIHTCTPPVGGMTP